MTHRTDGAPDHARSGRHREPLGLRRRSALIMGRLFKNQARLCSGGQHLFVEVAPVGGGILRSACSACGAVSLDLRDANEPVRSPLFTGKDGVKPFAILRRQVVRRP